MLDKEVEELEAQIKAWHRADEISRQLERIQGIGPLTASALVASIGDAKNLKNGRQLAAWLGLVPRQHSSGGRPTLLGMSKRGDVYLRYLDDSWLSLSDLSRRPENDPDSWLVKLIKRRNINVAAVALANKTARIVWALLTHKSEYQPDYRHSLMTA